MSSRNGGGGDSNLWERTFLSGWIWGGGVLGTLAAWVGFGEGLRCRKGKLGLGAIAHGGRPCRLSHGTLVGTGTVGCALGTPPVHPRSPSHFSAAWGRRQLLCVPLSEPQHVINRGVRPAEPEQGHPPPAPLRTPRPLAEACRGSQWPGPVGKSGVCPRSCQNAGSPPRGLRAPRESAHGCPAERRVETEAGVGQLGCRTGRRSGLVAPGGFLAFRLQPAFLTNPAGLPGLVTLTLR